MQMFPPSDVITVDCRTYLRVNMADLRHSQQVDRCFKVKCNTHWFRQVRG